MHCVHNYLRPLHKFLKTPLALLGVDLKNFQFNKICHFANHSYLCKGLYLLKNEVDDLNRLDNMFLDYIENLTKKKMRMQG